MSGLGSSLLPLLTPDPPTPAESRALRRFTCSHPRRVSVAALFGVHPRTIRDVDLGLTWGHVPNHPQGEP